MKVRLGGLSNGKKKFIFHRDGIVVDNKIELYMSHHTIILQILQLIQLILMEKLYCSLVVCIWLLRRG